MGSTPSSFDIVDPDGRRRRVYSSGPSDTVGDLAGALELDPFGVAIGGRVLPPHRRLVDVEQLRHGAAITMSSDGMEHSDDGDPGASIEIALTAGPGCTGWRALGAGRHLVGRGRRADIRVDDPFVERHVGFLDVETDGSVRFVQVAGSAPVRADGRPCHPGEEVAVTTNLEFGASRLEVRPPVGPRPPHRKATGDISARVRIPRLAQPMPPRSSVVDVPSSPVVHPPPPATALIGGVVGVVGSLAIGVLLGNPMFAAFALLGGVASFGTWIVGRIGSRRHNRHERERVAEEHRAFRAALRNARRVARARHRALHLDVSDALAASDQPDAGLWQRRFGTTGQAAVTLGRGAVEHRPALGGDPSREALVDLEGCSLLDDVGIPCVLEPGSVTALRGPKESVDALLRSLIVQLATWFAPTRVGVKIALAEHWQWSDWLPHATQPGELTVRATTRLDRPGPDRATLLVLGADDDIPDGCARVVEVGCTARGTVTSLEDTEAGPGFHRFEAAGISFIEAERAARRLAGFAEAEEGASGARLSSDVALTEVVGAVTESSVLRRWRVSARDGVIATPIGVSPDGPASIDLVADGPHVLVAGTTGSGKSEFLQSLVIGLAVHASPEDVAFVLADYKGGATFDACARLPHVAGLVTDLDAGSARRALVGLDAEVVRRERLLREVEAVDYAAYRTARTENHTLHPLPRLVIVIDEFAGLAKDVPDVLGALVAIAQRGRSLGVHLVLATQRPAGVVNDDIRANTDLRLALRLNDVSDARDVVDDVAPAEIRRDAPGRLVLRRAGGALVAVQTARTAPPAPVVRRLSVDVPDLADSGSADGVTSLVDAIAEAAAGAGFVAPHRPFLDPLPHPLEAADISPTVTAAAAVGVIDDPARQAWHPLRWDPAEGSLALVGAVGAGLTSTILTVLTQLCRTRPPRELEVLVLDAVGDDRLEAFAEVAHCAGVVRPHEIERMTRAVSRLVAEVDRRRAQPSRGRSAVVVAIDGVSALRAGVADHTSVAADLDRVLREGPAVGVSAVLADHGTTLCGSTYPVSSRWVFEQCDDIAAALVPGRVERSHAARPGRVWVATGGHRGCVAQIVRDADVAGDLPRREESIDAVAPVPLLPAVVRADLMAGHSRREELAIGLDAEDVGIATIAVPSDGHLLVVGGPRSGVTMTQDVVARGWAEVNGPDSVSRWRPGLDPTRIEELPRRDEPQLLVVDDAHRVDDDGLLRRIVEEGSVTVCAGGRLDAIRASYGHWTRAIASAGTGVVMTGRGPADGELFGVVLPRRQLVASRPGLGWVIDHAGEQLVQIAHVEPGGREPRHSDELATSGSGGSSPSR